MATSFQIWSEVGPRSVTARTAREKYISGKRYGDGADVVRDGLDGRVGPGEHEDRQDVEDGDLDRLELGSGDGGDEQARGQRGEHEQDAEAAGAGAGARRTGMLNQRSATNRIVTTLSREMPKYGKSFPRISSVRVMGEAMSWSSVPRSRSRGMLMAISMTVSSWRVRPMTPGIT